MTDPRLPGHPAPGPAPTFESQKIILLKEEAPRLPPSTGTDLFQATLFGAPALQPSRAEEPTKGISCGALLILILVFGPLTFFVLSQVRRLFS